MSETMPDRSEPRGCTLADLIALTFGAAIAASLYWSSDDQGSTTIFGKADPNWYVWSNSLVELIQKTCVALTPVILQRRWRAGGPLRPVEYLPILTAWQQISLSMWHWPILGILWEDPAFPGQISVKEEAFQAWKLSMFAFGVMAALFLFALRKRPRDWIFGLLVVLAWGRLTHAGEIYYQEWSNKQITSHGWPTSTIRLLSMTVIPFPIYLVVYVPLAISLVDLGGSQYRPRSWVEWAAIWLALPLPFYYEARTMATWWLEIGWLDFGARMRLGMCIIALGLAYLLA